MTSGPLAISIATGPAGFGASDAHIIPCSQGWTLWSRGVEPDRPPHSITGGGPNGRPCIVRAPAGTPLPEGFRELVGYDDGYVRHAPLALTEAQATEAGALALGSEGFYVVVREIAEGGRWTVATGIGSHTQHIRGSHPTPEEAEAVGVAACRRCTERRIEEIRAARGGDLSWGIPVPEIAPPPKVLHARPGQTGWDVLALSRPATAQEIR